MALGDAVPVAEDDPINSVTVRLYGTWVAIALIAAKRAMEARVLNEMHEDPSTVPAGAASEFRESLIAITAASFALEGFKNALVEMHGATANAVDVRPSETRSAAHWILGIIGSCFRVDVDRWRDNVVEIFVLRHGVVHHKTPEQPLAYHPGLRMLTAPERVAFRADVARDAVETVLQILEACEARHVQFSAASDDAIATARRVRAGAY